jgi:Xaa-Pro aminopeptidase
MRPVFDATPFRERRRQLAESLGDGLVIIPGTPTVVRHQDGYDSFRQRSDFFFLTGFDEADAVAVINPPGAKERFVLFVRPRDPAMELWHGRRSGIEGRSPRMAPTPPIPSISLSRSCARTPLAARRFTMP